MNVFIVDDSKIVCKGLRQTLSDIINVNVVGEAYNAGDAIKAILEIKPDVVILDIRLPGPSGIEVLKNIRDKKRPIRVIILTNYPYPLYRKKCEELEVDYFVDKVAEIENISHIINALKTKLPGPIKI